jgi:2-dehydropantoate 2-reductase
MFNTFQGTELYRAAVGAERFRFGFPNMTAYLVEQRLRCSVDGPGMVTTLMSPDLARLFSQAGMPAEVESDMDAFLRSHAALVVPLFLAALLTWQRKTNLTIAHAFIGAYRASSAFQSIETRQECRRVWPDGDALLD